jgi:hypothetical protein
MRPNRSNSNEIHEGFFYLLTILLLTACSGGSNSAVDLSGGGPITQGIAVDPYIEGAVFQEINAGSFLTLHLLSTVPVDFF